MSPAEQPKTTTANTSTTTTTTLPDQQSFPPPHFAFAGSPYPPPSGPFPPTFFAYPAPQDVQHTENGVNNAPPPFQVMYGPPGLVYAFPPPPPVPAASTPPPPIANGSARPKRQQVKMACTNCAAACKRCNDARPCERCQKYGIADSCVDGQRKERKKGVKRGPYKRKNKDSDSFEFEWTGPPPSAATTAAAMHAVAQLAPPPEGFYPIYYPPPPGTYPSVDGQTGPDGTQAGHPPPILPVYITGFPSYPYAPPGAIFVPPPPGTHPPPPPTVTTGPVVPATADVGSVPEVVRSQDYATNGVLNHHVESTANGINHGRKRRNSTKIMDDRSKKARTTANEHAGDGDLSADD